MFKKLTIGERVAYLASVPENMQEQVSKIVDEESAEEMKAELE